MSSPSHEDNIHNTIPCFYSNRVKDGHALQVISFLFVGVFVPSRFSNMLMGVFVKYFKKTECGFSRLNCPQHYCGNVCSFFYGLLPINAKTYSPGEGRRIIFHLI